MKPHPDRFHADLPAAPLPWIRVAADAPYFVEEGGAAWTPIGQNDAISWPELAPLFRRRDLAAVERHLIGLRASGVTCMRLMLEYAQVRHRYFERPAGRFVPAMVQLWDDLFRLCERTGLRILLTPVDTFWTWVHWRWHPWNAANGGPLAHPSQLLTCRDTRGFIKARLAFATRRWGGSGALFAWDLWNEIHPAQAEGSAEPFDAFIADLAGFMRELETSVHGRAHPLTVSLFGPELVLKPEMDMRTPIFRHPGLDFATLHVYEKGAMDAPRDTVAPALAMGRIVRESLAEIRDGRPFLDSEHGPIHLFKDRKHTLPAAFDDEAFRHTAWAHLAAGGAGGGMRWPNRHPHVLTPGMRAAQKAMADFLPLIDWPRFRRRPLEVAARHCHGFGCGDDAQALLWLVRRNTTGPDGRLRHDVPPVMPTVVVPDLRDGFYRVVAWDTERGCKVAELAVPSEAGRLAFTTPPILTDMAFAISAVSAAC